MPSEPSSPLILLVDDFVDAREMYAEYLVFRGYRVATAESGPEALQIAQSDRPALILMDIRMAGMDGTATMQSLRRDPTFADVPIVAFTAHALQDECEEAIRNGFDAVIPKPCLPDELVELIEPYLERARSA